MTETTGTVATDNELDVACLRMLPAARAFVEAVRSRDDARTRAAFAAIQRVDVPLGRSPLVVLALVLADEVALAVAINTSAPRRERERCVRLVADAFGDTPLRNTEQVRRLLERIKRGGPA